jgi:hypothetical protein
MSNAAHISDNNVSIASNVTSLGATDSISTALAPCCQKAVNDDRTIATNVCTVVLGFKQQGQ